MAQGNDQQPRGEKRKWEGKRLQHGSRSFKKRDLGRKEWNRQDRDKRGENSERANKIEREHEEGKRSALPAPYSQEEISKEERRPKHKVAVLIGYSGTGYKGMQITANERTIEGDLFKAFVEAGAISKANANDPKKSQLVRCARTDKGVHAAGNVISLKLIIEDADIVEKINSHLSPQIRVWGIQRTVNSFSSYQACDSRWYEYLIPTHSFLSPHPSSFLAKRLRDLADQAGDREGYELRQKEMEDFWEKVEEESIKPILNELPEDIKAKCLEALYEKDNDRKDPPYESKEVQDQLARELEGETKAQADITDSASKQDGEQTSAGGPESANKEEDASRQGAAVTTNPVENGAEKPEAAVHPALQRKRDMDTALRSLRKAYQAAKRSYRIQPERLARIQPILDEFVGTKNFHNYTIEKPFNDPSAKRHIKSWKVNPEPIVIRGTEWLSLKIHGQSFMMHQIRKMVAMVALTIRCGCDPARIRETFTKVDASIPKAPALGLLLERPVFDSYNAGAAKQYERETIGFDKYEDKVEAFKRTEIYQRQFDEEEDGNQFHQFFAHVDNLKDPQLLYLSSRGFEAVAEERQKRKDRAAAREADLAEDKVEGKVDSDDEESAKAGAKDHDA